MFGWMGTILRINLTEGSVKKEALDQEMALKYLGGRGLGVKLLYDEIDPKVDVLSPENKIIFAIGPLTAVRGPMTARYMVVSKGPLTGAIACSNSGGKWGAEMREAGYDAIILEGRAQEPVYIWINGDDVEIRPAHKVWGKGVTDTTNLLLKETNEKAKVACIGPAGENMSYMAAIMNEYHRTAARSGVGAVMGSKNVKAVVIRGTGRKVGVADPEGLAVVAKRWREKLAESPATSQGLPAYGTAMCVSPVNSQGAYPIKNGRENFIEDDTKINGQTLAEKYFVKRQGCSHCMIQCGRGTKVADGPYTCEGEGPEYESMWALGACCGIVDRLDSIVKANQLCDDLGFDTVSMGLTIACAMDLYEDGLIPVEDIGAPMKFGDSDMMLKMIEATGYNKGFGAKLALGSYRLAEYYGHPQYSLTSKKMEIAAYDPRAAQGVGLGYATSNRGACHCKSNIHQNELLGVEPVVDRNITEGKAQLVMTRQNFLTAVDAAGICGFLFFGIANSDFVDSLKVVTGIEFDMETVCKTGERIWNLEKLFNLKAGLTAEDDSLPERFLKEPTKNGPSAGRVNHLSEMLAEYYELRGWDVQGVPTSTKLQELGL